MIRRKISLVLTNEDINELNKGNYLGYKYNMVDITLEVSKEESMMAIEKVELDKGVELVKQNQNKTLQDMAVLVHKCEGCKHSTNAINGLVAIWSKYKLPQGESFIEVLRIVNDLHALHNQEEI